MGADGSGGGPEESDPLIPSVLRIERILEGGSGTPALALCDDGIRRVVKLSGAGGGPVALLTELLALRVSERFGAPVPGACPVVVPEGLPWTAGTDEFDAVLLRSAGHALGIEWADGAREMTADEALALPPATRRAIAGADARLANVDRTRANPNILRCTNGTPLAIDYDACLFLSRAVAGRPRGTGLPPGHLFSGIPPMPEPRLDWPAMLADLPDAWIAPTGLGRAALADALR